MLDKIIVTRTGGFPSNIQLSGDIKGLRQSLKDELGIVSDDTTDIVIPFTKATAYILLCYQKKFPNDIDIQDDIIIEYGKKTADPTTYLISDPYKQRKYLIVELPAFVPSYTSLAFLRVSMTDKNQFDFPIIVLDCLLVKIITIQLL